MAMYLKTVFKHTSSLMKVTSWIDNILGIDLKKALKHRNIQTKEQIQRVKYKVVIKSINI